MVEMDSRKRLVLKEIVDRYIKTGQPVSSQTLLANYGLAVSSATIRNDMKYLEEQGYIAKAYHSAGRVPMEKGFRFFVDWLAELSEVERLEQHAITEPYAFARQEIEALLRQTALLLAKISGYTSFVVSPRIEQTRLQSIALFKLDESNILVAILSELGLIESRIVPSTLTAEELAEIGELLNQQLRGRRLDETHDEVIRFSESDGWSQRVVRNAFILLKEMIDRRMQSRIYVEGLIQLLQNWLTEQRDLAEIQGLMTLLSDQERLAQYLRTQGDERIRAFIGTENSLELLQRSALVLQGYGFGGILGLLGPISMDYSKAFSVTHYVGNRLRAVLTMAQRETGVPSPGGVWSDA